VGSLRRINDVDLDRRRKTRFSLGEDKVADEEEHIHAAMEVQLRVNFLDCRDGWVEESLDRCVGEQGVLDEIEKYRTRCFEVATQYLAIFNPSSSNQSPIMPWDRSPTPLTTYLLRRIQYFTDTFLPSRTSSLTSAATLRDVLDASVFFATSLGSRGSIGANFSPLLVPIFEDALIRIVTTPWNSGLTVLETSLFNSRMVFSAEGLLTLLPPEGNRLSGEDVDSHSLRPPREMLAYPPLARMTNAILTGVNELRRCALPGTFHVLQRELEVAISKTENLLKDHLRAVLRPGLRGDAKAIREAAAALEGAFDSTFREFWRMVLDVAMGLEVKMNDSIVSNIEEDKNNKVTVDQVANETVEAE